MNFIIHLTERNSTSREELVKLKKSTKDIETVIPVIDEI